MKNILMVCMGIMGVVHLFVSTNENHLAIATLAFCLAYVLDNLKTES